MAHSSIGAVDSITLDHLARLRTSAMESFTAASIAEWVEKKTKIAGLPYSYLDHEFQRKILSCPDRETVVQKCSQIGLSEVTVRMALGLVANLQPYTVIYTLPTAKFLPKFVKTRVNPVIEGSEELSSMISKADDSIEVKRFLDSYLYFGGAASSNSPISIPADHLIHDEYDFSDLEVLSQYISRLTHSRHKRVSKFSTPTLPDYGINKAFRSSRRNFLFCKCSHCNHQFIPDYYKHVRIPGYHGDLRSINENNLPTIRYREAVLICPKCQGVPSLQPDYREWVTENPDQNFDATGFQVSPFDAPNIILVSDLIKASTQYKRRQDFDNFNLGQAAEDKEATLMRSDFERIFEVLYPGYSMPYVMGVDVGNVYHFVISAVGPFGQMYVVHSERVPMGKAREKYREFRAKYRTICTVIDSGPHAETVMALQAEDPNLYASIYTKLKSLVTHNVQVRDESKEDGQSFLRQVMVNRSRALDSYMEFLRTPGNMVINPMSDEEKELIITHHCSMKRVSRYDEDSGELYSTWVKTDGVDHYHHAYLYCYLASMIKGVAVNNLPIPAGVLVGIMGMNGFISRREEKKAQRPGMRFPMPPGLR